MRFISFNLYLAFALSASTLIQAAPFVSFHGLERRLIPVDTGNKPAIGLLRIDYRSGFLGFCTATLYQPDTLLTDKRCAIDASQAYRTRVFFENASGKPSYEVKSSLPYSLPQSGTNNEVGLLILNQPVDGIEPEPLNADSSLVITGKSLNYYSYDRTVPDGEPITPSAIDSLKRFQTHIAENERCAEIEGESENTTTDTFCFSGEADLPKHCLSENRGGPVYLADQESQGVIGIFTESEQCGGVNNSLLAANVADPDNQDFLIRQAGHKGRQSWRLQPDDGEQPIGYYNPGLPHCVATINGKGYTGYYYNRTNAQENSEGSANLAPNRGCMVFRDHTACVATQFSHVISPVFGEWTVPSATPDDERISFTDSAESSPCIRFTGTFSYREGIFPTVAGGRWNKSREVCEIWDSTKPLSDCDQVTDAADQGNLVTMPSDTLVAVLREGQAPDHCGKNYKDKFFYTSSALGALAIAEGITIFILSAVLYRKRSAPAAKE